MGLWRPDTSRWRLPGPDWRHSSSVISHSALQMIVNAAGTTRISVCRSVRTGQTTSCRIYQKSCPVTWLWVGGDLLLRETTHKKNPSPELKPNTTFSRTWPLFLKSQAWSKQFSPYPRCIAISLYDRRKRSQRLDTGLSMLFRSGPDYFPSYVSRSHQVSNLGPLWKKKIIVILWKIALQHTRKYDEPYFIDLFK